MQKQLKSNKLNHLSYSNALTPIQWVVRIIINFTPRAWDISKIEHISDGLVSYT
jgi:hypothetical protein